MHQTHFIADLESVTQKQPVIVMNVRIASPRFIKRHVYAL